MSACGSTLPEPVPANRGRPDYRVVPSEPPPALLELVPSAPRDDAVWVDGAWTYDGRHWVFERGGWAVLPFDYRRLPSALVFTSDGHILYAAPSWVNPQGRRVPAPSLLLPAASPSEPKVSATESIE